MTLHVLSRSVFACCIFITVILGVLSRVVQTHNVLFDKYLGDALYAMLIYLVISFILPSSSPLMKLLISIPTVLLIEAFQLTGIPLELSRSGSLPLQVIAIALGTGFSWLDIIAYLVGITSAYLLDQRFLVSRS